MSLSEQIRKKRNDMGLALAELARRANVSKGYLHQLEAGAEGQRPSADVLYRIAFALGTTVSELLEKRIEQEQDITTIPAELREFALAERLPEEDIKMLAHIKYRGERPRTVEDWRFIYESIKRSIPKKGE